MKFTIDIDVDQFNVFDEYEGEEKNGVNDFVNVVLDKVACQLLDIMSNEKDWYSLIDKRIADMNNTYRQKLENSMKKEISTVNFKKEITQNVIDDITPKIERSKSFDEIKKNITSEKEMEEWFGGLIRETVKKEIKNCFK